MDYVRDPDRSDSEILALLQTESLRHIARRLIAIQRDLAAVQDALRRATRAQDLLSRALWTAGARERSVLHLDEHCYLLQPLSESRTGITLLPEAPEPDLPAALD